MNQEEYRFYVYAYERKDGTPYYIGKGTGRRAYNTRRIINKPKDESRIKFYYNNLSESESFRLEKALIGFFGKKCDGTGILRNIADGGDGFSSDEARKTSIKARDEGKHNRSILTKDVIENIFFDTRVNTEIAKDYGVDRVVISDIKNKKRWKDITKDLVHSEEYYEKYNNNIINKLVTNVRLGESNGRSKLTENDVRKIREDKRTLKEIAEEYGIDRSNVGYIKNKKIWKHVI